MSEWIPFEEKLEDGTMRRGTMRLLDNSIENELEILRKLAAAVDSFQRSSKYVSGDFSEAYQMLVAYRAFVMGKLHKVEYK